MKQLANFKKMHLHQSFDSTASQCRLVFRPRSLHSVGLATEFESREQSMLAMTILTRLVFALCTRASCRPAYQVVG
jgi:hypothetical protein